MAITIKDVARETGISIATVSHVINGVHYVKPELAEEVLQAIRNTNYQVKAGREPGTVRLGEKPVITVIAPNMEGSLFTKIITCITQLCESRGYSVSIYLTFDDAVSEKRALENLVGSRQTAGIIVAPYGLDNKYYQKTRQRDMPLICIERAVSDHSISCAVTDSRGTIHRGTQTLLDSGHKKIGILMSDRGISTANEQLTGFLDAMYDASVHCDDSGIARMNLHNNKDCERVIISHYKGFKPTAYVTCGNRMTLILTSTFQKPMVDIPDQLSAIGFSDEPWYHLFGTPLTTFSHDCYRMAENALRLLFSRIDGKTEIEEAHILSLLEIRKSIKMIGRGPYGETTVSPDNSDLTPAKVKELQRHKYWVDVSFRYDNISWTAMHEEGLRYILLGYGVSIVSVTDSNSDPNLQVIQLKSLRMQDAGTIVAILVDDIATSSKFRQLPKETRLIFISNVPDGMSKGSYCSLIFTNERESSRNGTILLGEHFEKEDKVIAGLIIHGSKFPGAYLRGTVTEQTIREEYPSITIVESEPFCQIENTYGVVKKTILIHSEIKGFYVLWEGSALGAIRAIRELDRCDIRIATFDLDYEITGILTNEGTVLGLSAQKAYDQDVAADRATVKAPLNQRGYEYIGISPCVVERQSLLSAWREVMYEDAPDELAKVLKDKLSKRWNLDTKNRVSTHRHLSCPD